MNPLVASLQRRDLLSEEEVQALEGLAVTPPKRFAAGDDIVREGDRPRESCLVLTGFTGRYNTLAEGTRQISAIHVPGDFVDLHSFTLHLMDHGVTALSDCTIQTCPHEGLKAITERLPHLTRLLWLSTVIDAAIHRRWLVAMGRQTSASQLAHLLCELHIRLEVVGLATPAGYELPLTQAELGDVLGLSQVHVNRVVQDLKKRELISWSGKHLRVLDRPGLVAFAEFDPIYLNLVLEPR